MQSLEEACEEADHLMRLAQNRPSSIPLLQFKNGPAFFSIQNRLQRLYYEESLKKESLPIRDLKATSLLLEKLVAKENLNTLIVNLYPGNKGYSLAMRQSGSKGHNEKLTETVRWPYQMDTFLSYLDNGELPFMLVDLLEETYPEVFYSGCIIAEVRDYRQSYPHFSCNTHHILLQPTTQSVISDVNLLAAQSDLSSEEKVLLESELVLATQGPLCLDPSPSMVFLHTTAQHHRNLLSTEPLRRCARKFSQVSVNRKRKLDQFTSQPHLPLLDFISRRKGRIGSQARLHKKGLENISLEVPQIPVTRPLEMVPPSLTPPPEGSVEVAKFARAGEWPREVSDCTPQLVEEYILEADRGTGQIYHIKISLLQRVSNLEYIGELYVDKDYREGEKNGRTCRFPLGSRLQANHYIQQFSEIFTEEGRKSVRITHIVPGQPPRVSCTPGMRERDAKAQAQAKALARSTLAAVTSTTNLNTRIPTVNSSQTSNSVNNSVKSPADPVTVTNASSSSSTNPHPPSAASSNVNLVNALTSPPISAGFTNILTSGLLSTGQHPAAPIVNNLQPVTQVQAPNVDSSQAQQLQLKQPVIQQQPAGLSQHQPLVQQPHQPTPQPQQQQPPPLQSQTQSTQLRSHLETPSKIGGRTITNPEISALVTSLMNSAQQFQQQQQQQQQLQRQLQQQSAVKSIGVTSTVGAAAATKTVPNTLLNLLNSGTSGVSAGTGAGTQKVRKMTLSHLLNAKVLTPAQQQQLQQQFLQQQQQQQRVAVPLPTLSAQLASPPANETVLQHSLSAHPQVRFSSPNRVTLAQPVQQQSILPSFEVEVPSASGSATVNVNVAVPQYDVLDNETNAVSQVSSGGTASSTSTAVPLYDITPSNFNTIVNNFNPAAVQNFDSTVTVNTLTSPNSSISVNNSASNFDLQSLVDSALVSDSTTTSVPNYEISVSNSGSVPNFEIRVPSIDDTVSNSNALTSDLSGQVAANFEIPVPNSTNESANGDLLNQQSSGTASYQISFPDLNSFDNSNTLTVQNNFDFATATSYTTVPVNTKTVAVSSNASGTNNTNLSGSNLLGRILASGHASAAIRRLSANAAVASASSNSDSASNVHGLTALSALLAGTPSADNPIPGASSSLSSSSLLERLTASSSSTASAVSSNVTATPPLQFAVPSPSKPTVSASLPVNSPSASAASPVTPKSPAVAVASPMSSPPSQAANQGQQGLTVSGVNLQGLNLASLQGAIGTIPGLQNVQVSFPGMSSPISLSLSVSSATPHIASATVVSSAGTTGTVCGSSVSSSPHTMVLINPPLSVPVAQLMTSGVKAVNAQGGLRGIAANSIQIPQGSGQAIQLVGTLQRAKAGGQVTKANVLAGRQLQAAVLGGGQRKIPTSNTVAGTAQMTASNQVFLAQQPLHLIQKGVPYTQYQLQQQQQPPQQIQQQVQAKSGALAAQLTSKRRRSNAAEGTANK